MSAHDSSEEMGADRRNGFASWMVSEGLTWRRASMYPQLALSDLAKLMENFGRNGTAGTLIVTASERIHNRCTPCHFHLFVHSRKQRNVKLNQSFGSSQAPDGSLVGNLKRSR